MIRPEIKDTLLFFKEGNRLFFINKKADGSEDWGIGTYSSSAVAMSIDADNPDTIVFFTANDKKPITHRKFDKIANKSGDLYATVGSTAKSVFEALNLVDSVMEVSSGISGGATEAKQDVQITELQSTNTILTTNVLPNLGKQEVATNISTSNIAAINAVSFSIDPTIPATNYKIIEFVVSGTFVGTLQVQIVKNNIWSQTAVVFNFNNKNATVGNITTGGSYLIKIDARSTYRLVATAWTSGTAIISDAKGSFDDAPSYSDKTTTISGTVTTSISGTPTFNQAASTIFGTVDNASGSTTLRTGTSNVCSITIANSGGNAFVGIFDGGTAPTSANQTASRRAYAVIPSNSTVTIPFQPTVSFASNVFAYVATSHNGTTPVAAGQIVFSFVIR